MKYFEIEQSCTQTMNRWVLVYANDRREAEQKAADGYTLTATDWLNAFGDESDTVCHEIKEMSTDEVEDEYGEQWTALAERRMEDEVENAELAEK